MSVLNHRAQYVSFSRITKTGTAIERLGGRHRETERETERDRVHTGKKRGVREGLIIAKQCRKTK